MNSDGETKRGEVSGWLGMALRSRDHSVAIGHSEGWPRADEGGLCCPFLSEKQF